MSESVVVIGNGMAGLKLIEELERHGQALDRVTVIGAEPAPAYNRVLLSSMLAGETSAQEANLADRSWYAARGIQLQLGDAVAAVDPAARSLALASGRRLGFDRLVFATGSQPIRLPLPGAELDGVVAFRDLADLARIRAAAARARHAVVIGGGLLGLEAAYGLARIGLGVTLVHLMDRLMERQVDERAGLLIRQAIERLGIQVALSATTAAIEGEIRVEAVRLGCGRRIAAGLVVMAVGIKPEARLAAAAGLSVGRGIVVDDGLQSSIDGIHALGECAEHRGQVYGLVEPAYAQAKVLADQLTGGTSRYGGSVLATNLKVSGLPVFSAGDFHGGAGTDSVRFEDRPLGQYRKLVFGRGADGVERLVGALLVGDTADGLWYHGLIRARTDIAAIRRDLVFGRPFCEAA